MFLPLFCFFLLELFSASGRNTYIVHMNQIHMPMAFENRSQWYQASIQAISSSAKIVYSYSNALEGFAASLSAEEVEAPILQPGVALVAPEICYKLQTTRSPLFLGLDDHFPINVSTSDVVIGVIDGGVWPERRSFNDMGLGPPPRNWKGECETGTNFTASLCNNKLIGARYFLKGFEAKNGPLDESTDFRSPRDFSGHGTHTSSIAAGSAVKGASCLGYASGVARGLAPRSRVAIYKACWGDGYCLSSDILAAMDKAIEDNVNVLSISLGLGPLDYHKDGIAIGALAAIERGIFVSAAAGNSGPAESTLSNVAPWIATVGAGTIDRDFQATVILGNGKTFAGVSFLFQRHRGFTDEQAPLVYAELGGNFSGKILLVDMGMGVRGKDHATATAAKYNDALAIIYANTVLDEDEIQTRKESVPSMAVGKESGDEIWHYILNRSNPTARIKFRGTVIGVRPTPVVAGFSSRGPSSITPEILKPDMIAPGVNILAAWTGATGPGTDTESQFQI